MTFDRIYYERVWGTVHRHDYCETLRDAIQREYGQCRILDVGTGCGRLVLALRDRGFDAWGVDISPYAIAKSCTPSYVRLGDVRDLPFADNRFDVVFSQGLWQYVPEQDVAQAWQECLRVGNRQKHLIDTDEQCHPPEHQAITIKSREWWDEQLRYPTVLIACPNHECKEYAFQRWIAAVHQLDYPAYDVLVVDNSPTDAFYKRWRDTVPMVRLSEQHLKEPPNRRIALSMEVIRQHFLRGNYSYWFNLESDVIAPAETLRHMLKYKPADWILSYYPARGASTQMNGFGCSLFSRRLCEDSPFSDAPADTTTDGWWWRQIIQPQVREKNLEVVEIWNGMPLEHLDG